MSIEFETVDKTVETVEQEVPFEVEYVENPNLYQGTENVLQEGTLLQKEDPQKDRQNRKNRCIYDKLTC